MTPRVLDADPPPPPFQEASSQQSVAKGAKRYQRCPKEILGTLHPNIILKPNLTLTPTPTLSLVLTLALPLIKTEYWDLASGRGNISYTC